MFLISYCTAVEISIFHRLNFYKQSSIREICENIPPQKTCYTVIGEAIQNNILNQIHEGSKVFSIIADEARDI